MLWLKQYKVVQSHNMLSSFSHCHTVSAIVAVAYIHIICEATVKCDFSEAKLYCSDIIIYSLTI